MRIAAVGLAVATGLAAPLIAQRAACGPTRRPKDLPAVATIVDSSAAMRELQTAQVLGDSVRFTLIFPAGDSMPFIHPLDSTQIRAAAVLARSVWPQGPDQLWAI